METHSCSFIDVHQKGRHFLLTSLPAAVLAHISYASVRGEHEEPGAVQRFLNPSRIASIRDYTLQVGTFPASLVLNWVQREFPLQRNGNQLLVPQVERAAQIIDGQHRMAGIRAAIQEKGELASLELPVALYEFLETRDCADIFLSINTEQKPVPRSLVYDLYGVASEEIIDPPAVRARDIASSLNEERSSPYFQLIKFPGTPRFKGGIALSTAVSAIKPLVEEKGVLEQVGITELEMQMTIIFNFFKALKSLYGDAWLDKSNAFLYAAGFTGGIEFFKNRIVPYCINQRSFKLEVMQQALELLSDNPIHQEEVKGIGGKDAPRLIHERLVKAFTPVSDTGKFEV
jgi:DGQHR domain-containing protein